MPTDKLRAELEAFRVEWERVNNRRVDLTKHYTSMWPSHAKDWLIAHDMQRYYDGLPEFVQDFIRAKMDVAARTGALDTMHEAYIKLYMSGGMNKNRRSR